MFLHWSDRQCAFGGFGVPGSEATRQPLCLVDGKVKLFLSYFQRICPCCRGTPVARAPADGSPQVAETAGGAGTTARANNPSTDILVRQRDPDICRDATVKIQFLCFSYPANAGRGSTESPTYRLFFHSHTATCGLPATSQAEVCRSNIEKDVTNKYINLYE